MKISKKLYRFYFHDCCFPYSFSFLFVVLIYTIDFFAYENPLIWPSVGAYSIITAYYLLNLRYYVKKTLVFDDPTFFISVLTVKILLWGMVLLGLLIVRESQRRT